MRIILTAILLSLLFSGCSQKVVIQLEKQSSVQLGIYGEAYLQEMKDYIANIIRISNEAELNGTKVEDIQWQ